MRQEQAFYASDDFYTSFASRAWRGFVDPMIARRREVRDLSDLLCRDYPNL